MGFGASIGTRQKPWPMRSRYPFMTGSPVYFISTSSLQCIVTPSKWGWNIIINPWSENVVPPVSECWIPGAMMPSPASGGSPGRWTRVLPDACVIPPFADLISLSEGPNLCSPARSASRGVMMLVPEYPVLSMLDGLSRTFQLAATASARLMVGSGGGADLRALRQAAARACNRLMCFLFGRRRQAIESLALCTPPHLSLIMIPRRRSGSRSGLLKLLFRRRFSSLIFRLLCLSFRWMARCSSALRSNLLLSLRLFAASFRLLCCHSLVTIVGSARSRSRALGVAAFSATCSTFSCSRAFAAASLSRSIRVALARARSSACVHWRDDLVAGDWAGENRVGGWDCGRACWDFSNSETCS